MATFTGVIVRRLSNFTNVYNRMETTNKKIRGSAFVDNEGLFVFTPYATVDPEKRSLKLVFAGRYATAWVGKRRVCVRFSWTGAGQKRAEGPKSIHCSPKSIRNSAEKTAPPNAAAAEPCAPFCGALIWLFHTSCRLTAVPKASF